MNRLPTFPRSAYLPPPAAIRRRTTAAARGWAKGWPNDPPAKLVAVEVTRADGRVFRPRVDERLANLVGFLMSGTMLLGYEFRGAKEPDGGVGSYDFRPIKGSNPPKPSNHSSGTALDLNTKGNPMLYLNRPDAFRSTQPPWMVELWAAAGFYWGGWYGDAMHFEMMLRPEDVPNAMAAAKTKYAEIRLRLFGGRTVLERGAKGDEVRALQLRLNAHGFPVDVVGRFGPATEAAVKAFQAAHGLQADGVVGPETRAALDAEPAEPSPGDPPPVEPPPVNPCADCGTKLDLANAEIERHRVVRQATRQAFAELEADLQIEDNASMQRTIAMAVVKGTL